MVWMTSPRSGSSPAALGVALASVAALAFGMVLASAGCGPGDGSEGASCPPSSGGPPTGKHRLYLSFDGETIAPGEDDAPAGRSSLVPGEVTVPRFLAAMPAPDADAAIATIAGAVAASLFVFDVEVTTERPAEGPYDMIVFGGVSDAVVGLRGVQFAVTARCAPDASGSAVGFVFDVRKPLLATAATAVGVYAVMHGATTTARAGDCLCLEDEACTALPSACTFGAGVPGSAGAVCTPQAKVDSVAEMIDAIGCRP